MGYRVVIPTAGIGSRLGSLTKYINKSLVSIANRPIISHVIEQFPDDCEFVIALGYKGNLVKDFLELAYPNKVFYFAYVTPYEGSGSGLGLSLIACEKYLQEPFVFISCDDDSDAETKEPLIIGDTQKLADISNEYAATGIAILFNALKYTKDQTPLWNLVEYFKDNL